MEADAHRIEAGKDATDWDAVFTEVNAWRGACLHHFSAVEMAVTETLLTLDAASTQASAIRLRQLIGQRFEDLAAAIGPERKGIVDEPEIMLEIVGVDVVRDPAPA